MSDSRSVRLAPHSQTRIRCHIPPGELIHMTPEINQILFTLAVLMIAVLLPLLPTVVIYRLFPGTEVIVSGPFRGMTVRAAGAFGAYFITFLAAGPLAWRTFDAVNFGSPTWTVTGKLMAFDQNGNEIADESLFSKMSVTLAPQTFSTTNGRLWIKVPEIDGSIPSVSFYVPGFGSASIDVTEMVEDGATAERDDAGRVIKINAPIVIRQSATTVKPYSGSEATAQPPAVQGMPPPPPSS